MKILSNKYFRAGLIVLLVLLIVGLKFCNTPVIYTPVSVKEEMKTRDSIIKIVEYKDSIRTIYVTKWRKAKVNPESLPCDTFVHEIIAICDTLIKADSSQISSLNGVIKQDSVIARRLSDKVLEDSVTIGKLNRKLRRQKLITKAAFVTGFGLGAFAGFKIH